MANQQSKFAHAAAEAVKEELRIGAWTIYPHYRVGHTSDGETCAIAERGKRAQRRELVRHYAPLLQTPGLFLEFAGLADREITQDVWIDWLHTYGVLGLERMSKPYQAWDRGGGGETFFRFKEEAQMANKALRLYEAATDPKEGPDVAAIAGHIPKHYRPYYTRTRDRAKEWALREVDTLVQEKLKTECYPQLYRTSDGSALPSWGFHSLLGAMWLQMMFLLTTTGKVRYCKGLGCSRVITFDQPRLPRDPTAVNDRRRGYKTRCDKVFCSDACKMKWHYHNKKGTQRP